MTAFTGTIEQALAYANSRPIVLADVVAGQHLYHWTQDGTYTNCWYTTAVAPVVALRCNGVPYTESATLAVLDTFSGGWLYDPATKRLYVNPSVSVYTDGTYLALVAFAWSNHPRDVSGVPYQPRLAATPALDMSIPARFTQQETSRGGNLEAEQAEGSTPTDAGAFDALAALDWDAGYATLRFGADPVF